ncbi:hypothetical protein ACQCT3_10985 [Sutcliffiella horikoshii]|uniref:hypothetical protein n=1 Tax=Bacillaceae TaxID=186817 RepID=UPI0001E89CAE|nr:hypothetical protein [Bacillus sp. m3-13]
MEFIGTIFFMVGGGLTFNFIFALLYILSRSAGRGFYRWITHGGLLDVLCFPVIGLTQWAAGSIYERYNWFVARVLLIFYAMFILIVAILCFIIFGYIADQY